MSGGTGDGWRGYTCVLPFDTDSAEFRRGAEIGMLWAMVTEHGAATAAVHADCAEMVMRIAEAKGLPFTAEPLGEDFLHVTIGHAVTGVR